MPTRDPEAVRRCVQDLHNTLININDSLHSTSITIRDQTFALKSALDKIKQELDEMDELKETANEKMRRLYAAAGMEYDEISELPGMERACKIMERKMRKSGW